jgi:hypothetical protein
MLIFKIQVPAKLHKSKRVKKNTGIDWARVLGNILQTKG